MNKKFTKALALVFATCATCMAFGSCGEKKPDWMTDIENAITGHEHTYAVTYRIEPDCETMGLKVYECSCGDIYTKKTPTAHHFVFIPGDTIEDEGWYECDLCGCEYLADWYSDVYMYSQSGLWALEEYTQEVNWYNG